MDHHQPILELRSVGLAYRKVCARPWSSSRFWAVEDVTFSIKRGDRLGVIGRNGAGKSSLLKLIAGIINPDRGVVIRRCNATLLSLGAGFEEQLTGRQNIMLSGLQLGMTHRHIRSRSGAIAELAGIGEFIDEPVRAYSSGMRSRLGFAIAYHIEADLLLIDEIFATGDAAFREQANDLLNRRVEEGVSIVLVSHSMGLVRTLCSRVIRIEHGCSLPEGPPEEAIAAYLSDRSPAARPPAPPV